MKNDWKPMDIVQIDPESDPVFGACFMVVTEPKPWGAQGYCVSPGVEGQAYYRVKTENAIKVGQAAWVADRNWDE